jgi:hypothetical protein
MRNGSGAAWGPVVQSRIIISPSCFGVWNIFTHESGSPRVTAVHEEQWNIHIEHVIPVRETEAYELWLFEM